MSSTLLLCSNSLRSNLSPYTYEWNNDVIYEYFFEDTTKDPWEKGRTTNWTSKFPKGYPYTSLKEGQVFELEGKYYYVKTVKESKCFPNNPIKRRVWFCLDNEHKNY